MRQSLIWRGWGCVLAAQINVDSMPLGPDNPHGVGFVATETEFSREQEAIREVDPRRSRVWKIKNEASRNVNTGAYDALFDACLAPCPLQSAACMHPNPLLISQVVHSHQAALPPCSASCSVDCLQCPTVSHSVCEGSLTPLQCLMQRGLLAVPHSVPQCLRRQCGCSGSVHPG